MSFPLFCFGNPLLDIQIKNGEELLNKYGLKANDAVLANEKQAPIYADVVKNYQVEYLAGGAAQNAARAAAYILPPKSVVYTGCVGDDDLADQLRKANDKEGLTSAYLVKKGEQTGACAVVITGHHRSLVTTLRAAEKFEKSHLSSSEIAPLLDGASHVYTEGFFLTHGAESALDIAKKASEGGKFFAINLSAPFIAQFFKVQLESIIPYADLVIGNESEAAAWAEASGLPDPKDLGAIAKSIAELSKVNLSRQRTVVITSGAEQTIVYTAGEIKTYPVTALKEEEIVDTNGAGDAFAGGFIGSLVLGKTIDEAVIVGHKLGAMCVGQPGPQLKWPKVQVV